MKTYPVKFYNESMQGAPQMTQNPVGGQMIAILKACLVDGFGSLVPDAIVWDETELLAKASFSGGHAYEKDSVIACSGSAVTDYNGEHRILQVTNTEIWFELDTVPVAPASGSLEIKVAPLGWEITHSNLNEDIIIFRPAGDLGNVSVRFDNSEYSGFYNGSAYSTHARIAMVENVVDIDGYDEIYDSAWAASGKYTDCKWDLVGDNRIFYYLTKYGRGEEFGGYIAGYIDSIRAGDRYHFIMNHITYPNHDANNGEWDYASDLYYTYFAKNFSTSQNVMARKYHQLEGTTGGMKSGLRTYNSDVMQVPNPVDNGFYINTEKAMVLESDNSFRGYMPIMVYPLGNHTIYWRKNLQELPDHPNKIFRMLRATHDAHSDLSAVLVGFDISTVEV